jgi:hypothetical protein
VKAGNGPDTDGYGTGSTGKSRVTPFTFMFQETARLIGLKSMIKRKRKGRKEDAKIAKDVDCFALP